MADKPLDDRRKAIRKALYDLPEAKKLHSDFYDRERMATWVNEYPGIVAWVRDRVGIGSVGWSSIGHWTGTSVESPMLYFIDEKTCLTDERSRDREQITVGEGITRLQAALRLPRQSVRLIGL